MSKTKVKIVNNCCSPTSFILGVILGILVAALIAVFLKKKKGVDILEKLLLISNKAAINKTMSSKSKTRGHV